MYALNNCKDFTLRYDLITRIKDTLSGLKLNEKTDIKIYNKARLEFLSVFEGLRYQAYYDFTGKSVSSYTDRPANSGYITIGIGFNMEAANAKQSWLSIFPNESFYYDVLNGKQVLTQEQIMLLLDKSLEQREKELSTIYKNYWTVFSPNIRLAIEGLYYNIPSLVRSGTIFYKKITDFVDSNNIDDLLEACSALLEHQHRIFQPQLHQRRQFECLLMGINSEFIFN